MPSSGSAGPVRSRTTPSSTTLSSSSRVEEGPVGTGSAVGRLGSDASTPSAAAVSQPPVSERTDGCSTRVSRSTGPSSTHEVMAVIIP